MSNSLIFISYSQKDKTWKEQLDEQLGVLEQQDTFEVWSDLEIGTGDDWEKKIEDALDNACVAILLVSSGSLSSSVILRKELVRMLRRRDEEGLLIYPIIARDCAWEEVEWLKRLNVRPRDKMSLQAKTAAKRMTELKNIVQEIARIVQSRSGLTPAPSSDGSIDRTPDRARPEAVPMSIEIEAPQASDPLKDLEEQAANDPELRRKLYDMASRLKTKGKQSSTPITFYEEGSAKKPKGPTQQTTTAFSEDELRGKRNAKKGK